MFCSRHLGYRVRHALATIWGIQSAKMPDVDWQSHGNLANCQGFLQISAAANSGSYDGRAHQAPNKCCNIRMSAICSNRTD
jgi:hypothetical protein